MDRKQCLLKNGLNYVSVCIIILVFSQSSNSENLTDNIIPIEDAVNMVQQVTGLSYNNKKELEIDSTLIEDNNTPFVADKINGTIAWEITYSSVSLDIDTVYSQAHTMHVSVFWSSPEKTDRELSWFCHQLSFS